MAKSGIASMLENRITLQRYRIWREEEYGFDAISISGNYDYMWNASGAMRIFIPKTPSRDERQLIEMTKNQTMHVIGSNIHRFYMFTDRAVIKYESGGQDAPGLEITVKQYLDEINRIY